MKTLPLVFLLAAGAAWAGPYDQPYSIITTDTARSADPNLRPVIVNRVDDENTLRNKAVVAPGAHKVTIDLPPRKGHRLATQQTFELVTRPCVRYLVAAKLDTPVTQDWKPVVRSEERIGECEAKFKVAGGK
jgi:hypothetical protein